MLVLVRGELRRVADAVERWRELKGWPLTCYGVCENRAAWGLGNLLITAEQEPEGVRFRTDYYAGAPEDGRVGDRVLEDLQRHLDRAFGRIPDFLDVVAAETLRHFPPYLCSPEEHDAWRAQWSKPVEQAAREWLAEAVDGMVRTPAAESKSEGLFEGFEFFGKPGRPRDSGYDWAFEEIRRGRSEDEVYEEWRRRPDVAERWQQMEDPWEAFRSAMKRRKQQGRTKPT